MKRFVWNENLFRSISQNLSSLIMIVDQGHRIIYSNQIAVDVFGGNLIGLLLNDVLTGGMSHLMLKFI